MVRKVMPFSSLRLSPSKLFFVIALAWFLSACGGEYSGVQDTTPDSTNEVTTDTKTDNNTTVSTSSQKIDEGHKTYVEDCSVCHGSSEVVMSSASQTGLSAEPLTDLLSVSELTVSVENHPSSGTAMNCTGECAENVAMYVHYAFVEPTHFPNQALNLYAQQCASCHDGRGDLEVLDCKGCDSLDGLSQYIEMTMPTGNVTSCGPSCARETAKYILADFKQVDYFVANEVKERPLTAAFSLSTTSGVAPLPVSLNATESTGTGNLQYRWQVTGPNGFSNQRSGVMAAVNLTGLGTYTVTLVVSDQSGESTQLSKVVSVTAEEECPSVESYFQEHAWPVFKDTCAQCHTASGNASNTNLVYEMDDSQAAFNHILEYADGDWNQGSGVELLMDKPLETNGMTHGGYKQLVEGQLNYYRLENFAQLIANKESCDYQQNLSPIADFSASQVSGVEPLMVNFDASSSSDPEGDSLKFHWDFGNGFEGNYNSATQIYSAGTYTATLTVTDSLGKTDKASVTITVSENETANQAPTAIISAVSPMLANVKSEIFFDGSASTDDGTIVSYEWALDNGDTREGPSFNYAYTEAGTYSVQLIVTDDQGSKNATSVVVQVAQPNRSPIIQSLTSSESSGASPLVVSFSAVVSDADDDELTYEWSYQGQTSTSDNWVLNLDTAGTHTISLTVTDPDGLSDTASVAVEVSGADTCSLPVEVFDESAWTVFHDSCGLCHTSSGDAYNSGLVYETEPKDETESEATVQAAAFNLIYAYAEKTVFGKPGHELLVNKPAEENGVNHSGGLQAVNGSHNYFVLTNFVESFLNEEACKDERNQAPVALISSNYKRAPAPLMVSFSAAQSSDPEGGSLTYAWDLSDGNSASSAETSFVFGQGNHTVTLTVTDEMGKSDTETFSFIVDEPLSNNEAPKADASAAKTTEANTGQEIEFDGSQSTDDVGIVSYEWDFGDGSPKTKGMAVKHIYSTEGKYTVLLVVTDGDNAQGSTSYEINIVKPNSAPVITAVNSSSFSGVAPLAVNFDASVMDPDGDDLTYSWSNNLEQSSAGETWVNNFVDPGSYTVTLKVTDSGGLSDSKTIEIQVNEAIQCVLPSEEFEESTWSVFESTCAQCHTESGEANQSGLVYDVTDAASAFAGVDFYAQRSWLEGEGYQLLLDKPALQNEATHGGDLRLENGTEEYYLVANLAKAYLNQQDCELERNEAPTAQITSDYVRGSAPLSVNFDASQSSDPEGGALTYEWGFGDSQRDAGVSSSFIFAEGNHTISLTVTDELGKSDTSSISIVVDASVSVNDAPTAVANADAVEVSVGQMVSFDANASTDDVGIETYVWQIPNEDPVEGAAINYAFDVPGSYSVRLTVTDGEGAQDIDLIEITVTQDNRAPQPTISSSIENGVAPLVVSFEAAANDPDLDDTATYEWSYGSQTSSKKSWALNFTEAGNYTVDLKVTDSTGASGTTSTTITVTDPASCVTTEDYFADRTWDLVNSYVDNQGVNRSCTGCHKSTGAYDGDELIMVEGNASESFAVLRNYVLLNDGASVLAKTRGLQSHGGGLVHPEGSYGYLQLENIVNKIENPVPCDPEVIVDPGTGGGDDTPDVTDFWSGVNFLSPADTLRKATLLFAGRLPTDAELSGLTESNLRTRIRNTMVGDNFDSFIRESTNDQVLTEMYAYEHAALRALGKIWGSDLYTDQAINKQLAREPLQRMVYIINREQPYSEYLTGEYILVTPRMSGFFNYSRAPVFNDPSNLNEWATATLKTPEVRDSSNSGLVALPEQDYPHAGVLNSPMWLLRYQTTDSNRNRHRARFAMIQFLGFDIENLLTRSTDPAALMDTDNPTYKNSSCTGCHNIMDPIAGLFMNFKNRGEYRPMAINGRTANAMAFDYVKQGFENGVKFQQGDLWYRHRYEIEGQLFEGLDIIGFNGKEIPTNGGPQTDDSSLKSPLRWLANEFIADERFKTAAVKFWFPAVFSQDPLVGAGEKNDPNYGWKLKAFTAQQAAINEWANYFLQDHGYGTMNVKDLLSQMVVSKWFRADSVEPSMTEGKRDSLQLSGVGKLLTPEQLHRKIKGLTDFAWGVDYYTPINNFIEEGRFRVPYGGQDSDANVKRTRTMDSMKETIATRMSLEVGCGSTIKDFGKNAANRLLFPYVESTDVPDNGSSTEKIKKNIQHLYRHLLNQHVSVDSEEVSLVYDLFVSIRNEGFGSEGDFAGCDVFYQFPTHRDDEYTVRSWMAVMAFFLGDFYFLYD